MSEAISEGVRLSWRDPVKRQRRVSAITAAWDDPLRRATMRALKAGPRAKAADAGERFYDGRPCVKGHGVKRYALGGRCVVCASRKMQIKRRRNQ